MVAVPTETPVMIPVVFPADATALLLLVHVPAPPELASVVVVPVQNTVVPVIAPGEALTANVAVAEQPLAV